MSIPLQVTFHGMEVSEALNAHILQQAAKLEHFSGSIMRCHVVVESSERRHHKGNRYQVQVHLKLPGADIQAGHGPFARDHFSEDPYAAVRDSFDAARRQLQDYERERRGDVKTHAGPREA